MNPVKSLAANNRIMSPSLLPFVSAFVLLSATVSAQNCSDLDNCSGRGICDGVGGNWTCICEDEWATFPVPGPGDAEVYCNYERKEQLTAFLLSFFLGGWGAGHWYIEQYEYAGWKLGYTLGFCCCGTCLWFCICACAAGGSMSNMSLDDLTAGGAMAFVPCWFCCLTLGMLAWNIYDLVIFGQV